MARFNRRTFLYQSALAGGAFAWQGLIARGALLASEPGTHLATNGHGGYGPLKPVKTRNTGEFLLALPDGFEYVVFGKTGAMMSDGNQTPGQHDGMAAFAVAGKIRLVRNHEINNRGGKQGVAIGKNGTSYDTLAGGGTATLVVDPKTRKLVKDFVSLSGTLQNCAGGPTPWGSWITCEETVLGKTRLSNVLGGFEQSHGYCFEVNASSDGLIMPVPLKTMGRFVHEAIAVDPTSGIVYETEDREKAGFYQFIPDKKGNLTAGGRLQMLAIKGRHNYDTRTGQTVGVPLPVIWVSIDDPDPAGAETNDLAVYQQGVAKGGTTFSRLEGCCYAGGHIYFNSTSGGDKALGQVWEYQPKSASGGILTLLFEPSDAAVLNMPDNICQSPRGGLVICEDNGTNTHYLRGLTRRGLIFDVAKNIVPGHENREFAGTTFSPDGQTLFVNIQDPGFTLAIWGPWKQGAL